MGLFEFLDEMNWKKRCELAEKELDARFGLRKVNNRFWDARWYADNGKLFVLMVSRYINNKFVRREFYEFRKTSWEYVGYIDRNTCLEFYWRIKTDVTGGNIRNRNDREQDERVVCHNLDAYYANYKRLVKRQAPPNDGAITPDNRDCIWNKK